MYIQGINLGNWLVLEKWMSPALFEGTTAADEYYLPQHLSKEVYEARIRQHRAEYISERDFAYLKSVGINTVRIPVPYFVFGDRPPFLGCIQELDNAFAWAQHYGIQILIDLHTVPGSQNGFDNGGISGVCCWAGQPSEVSFVVSVLEKLAQRYGKHPALWGIEPINEPVTQEVWDKLNLQARFVPVDKELGARSQPATFVFLEQFYLDTYTAIRKHAAQDKYVVFHDAFALKRWQSFLTTHALTQVALDTHYYLAVHEMMGCEKTPEGYEECVRETIARDLAQVRQTVPVVVGEWCLFNSYCCGTDTQGAMSPVQGMKNTSAQRTPAELAAVYQRLAKAQLEAFRQGSGHFWWSYKLLIDTVNNPDWRGWESWDFGTSTAKQWLPRLEGQE